MKHTLFIQIDIVGFIFFQNMPRDIILDGHDVMIHEYLSSRFRAGKTAYAVIHGNDIRIKACNELFERFQRRYFPAGGNVDVCPKSTNPVLGMAFRIGVYRQVAFIEMPHKTRGNFFFRNQHRNGRALRFVILLRDVQDLCADPARHIRQNLRQAARVITFIYIFDIALPVLFCIGIANIVQIKAQRFREIVEPI